MKGFPLLKRIVIYYAIHHISVLIIISAYPVWLFTTRDYYREYYIRWWINSPLKILEAISHL